MAKEVILTPLAISDYEKIVEYLIKRCRVFVTNDFIDRLTDICSLIAENPERFPLKTSLNKYSDA
jgi:plasmid stabilization system protein ParE